MSSAQINRHIDYDDIKNNPPSRDGWPWGRYFWGSLDLDDPPAPLKPTKVSFTLEAAHGDVPGKEGEDWTVKLFTNTDFVQIIGDSLFNWPGPHKAGDMYSNEFEFIPLVSGLQGISLEIPGTRENISVYWCLDMDGNLAYLGRDKATKFNCCKSRVIFFGKDSISFNRHVDIRNSREYFDYFITISPVPKIGDTCVVHYMFKPITDFSSNMGVNLYARCMDFVSISEKPNIPILKGDVIDMYFKFIPAPVKSEHQISLSFTDSVTKGIPPSHNQDIHMLFVFSNDSTLKYFSNSLIYIDNDLQPANFRKYDPYRDIYQKHLQGRREKIR